MVQDHPVVNYIKALLKEAEEGKIIGLAAVTLHSDGEIGIKQCHSTMNSDVIVEGLSSLLARYKNQIGQQQH